VQPAPNTARTGCHHDTPTSKVLLTKILAHRVLNVMIEQPKVKLAAIPGTTGPKAPDLDVRPHAGSYPIATPAFIRPGPDLRIVDVNDTQETTKSNAHAYYR